MSSGLGTGGTATADSASLKEFHGGMTDGNEAVPVGFDEGVLRALCDMGVSEPEGAWFLKALDLFMQQAHC